MMARICCQKSKAGFKEIFNFLSGGCENEI